MTLPIIALGLLAVVALAVYDWPMLMALPAFLLSIISGMAAFVSWMMAGSFWRGVWFLLAAIAFGYFASWWNKRHPANG